MAIDLETCCTYIYAHQLIADQLEAKAFALIESVRMSDDISERKAFLAWACNARKRAQLHRALAQQQQDDLGLRCHCRGWDAVAPENLLQPASITIPSDLQP